MPLRATVLTTTLTPVVSGVRDSNHAPVVSLDEVTLSIATR